MSHVAQLSTNGKNFSSATIHSSKSFIFSIKNAFSGSSRFENAKNNLVYEFENNSENNITLTLDIKSIYGDVSTEVFTTRFFTENYKTAFKVTIK